MSVQESRRDVVSVAVTPAEKELIKLAASAHETDVSNYLRDVNVAAAIAEGERLRALAKGAAA